MKKTLLNIAAGLLLATQLPAQVTRISDNTSLAAGYPISSTKVILTDYNNGTLWVSDATEAGTVQIATSAVFDDEGGVAVMNGKFYFAGKTTANGSELWVSDGTSAGTKLVKDINAGTGNSRPTAMISFNGKLYFYANTPAYGPELWISDGTEDGTKLLKDIKPGTTGSYDASEEYTIFKNEIYFSANSNGTELWKTNGTENGTVLLKEINPGALSAQPRFLDQTSSKLFFSADNGTEGSELWATDGTQNGTALVKDIFPGATGSNAMNGVNVNDKLVFSARNTGLNDELWVSDGTEAGTFMLKDIFQGTGGSDPDAPGGVFFGNKLLFAATSNAYGRELYMTDGTIAGTDLYMDIQAGAQGSNPVIMQDRNILTGTANPMRTLWNNKIFIQTSLGTPPLTSNALWITNGTPGNITLVKDFGFVGLLGSWFYTQSGLYLSGKDQTKGYELFKSGGTPQTTALFADVNDGLGDSYPFFLFFMINGKVFFSADDGNSDGYFRDLFVIDGPEVPLPLQLLSFSASAKPAAVSLNWATTNESDMNLFEVQRSTDGVNFTTIGTVKAIGNTNSKHEYGFDDATAYQLGAANLYYRIKMLDLNGKFAYSGIALIQSGKPLTTGLVAAPNPAHNVIRLNFTAESEEAANLVIVNNAGQPVQQNSFRLSKGANQQVINLANVPAGVYNVVLRVKGDIIATTRFIKQ